MRLKRDGQFYESYMVLSEQTSHTGQVLSGFLKTVPCNAVDSIIRRRNNYNRIRHGTVLLRFLENNNILVKKICPIFEYSVATRGNKFTNRGNIFHHKFVMDRQNILLP